MLAQTAFTVGFSTYEICVTVSDLVGDGVWPGRSSEPEDNHERRYSRGDTQAQPAGSDGDAFCGEHHEAALPSVDSIYGY